jgi:transcriptional regulator with XRE-family HTH domain
MDAKKFGKKIKLARIENDMTQGDLAKAIGALQKAISRYETGVSVPSVEMLQKIAKILNKPRRSLLRREMHSELLIARFFRN